jgi:hypothetical protein
MGECFAPTRMNLNPLPLRLLVVAAAILITLAACTQSVSEQEQITNRQTIIAGTPSPTATFTPTVTPSPTMTPTDTVGPSPTATITPSPTVTPPPPTPTANPALTGFSLCEQVAGGSGRFSARLSAVTVNGFPAFERVSMVFEQAEGSAPLSASASCVSERDFLDLSGEASAPGPFVLQVNLAEWLRDDNFSASPLTQTLSFTNTSIIKGASFRVDQNSSAGATMLIGLNEALPYRLKVERDPLRLTIEVAKSSTLVASSDPLNLVPNEARVDAPELFFSFDGDIWRTRRPDRMAIPGLTQQAAGAANLTNSVESETDFAVSPDGATVAFCRAVAGVDPTESSFAVPSALWLMDSDGNNQRLFAQVGINCATPVWSLDGSRIAFSVDETGATPTQRSIWVVPARGGTPELLAGGDEWSRSDPQWLASNSLVYTGAADDGRRTLFLRTAAGEESDIGADLLLDDEGEVRYSSLLQPVSAPDGRQFAVVAPRIDGYGAELLLLNADGTLIEALGGGGTGRREYWTRPLGWTDDGQLLYLSTVCRSTLVQEYTVQRWAGLGRSEVLLAGTSLQAIGAATPVGPGLAYVVAERGASGPRGPGIVAPRSPAALWYWDIAGGNRGVLLNTERGIGRVQ